VCAVLVFERELATGGVVLGFTMLLCDASSVVAEFMIRVLHWRSGIRIHDVAEVEAWCDDMPFISAAILKVGSSAATCQACH
jgi:hypothetical protein